MVVCVQVGDEDGFQTAKDLSCSFGSVETNYLSVSALATVQEDKAIKTITNKRSQHDFKESLIQFKKYLISTKIAEVFLVLLGTADPVPKKMIFGYFRSLSGTVLVLDIFRDSIAAGNPGTASVSSKYCLRLSRGIST